MTIAVELPAAVMQFSRSASRYEHRTLLTYGSDGLRMRRNAATMAG